jgi:minor extracellular serine protease Vpr
MKRRLFGIAAMLSTWSRNPGPQGFRTGSAVPLALIALVLSGAALADPLAFQQTGADIALARYGLTGKGVVVAILDRGIQWQNPDFIKPDGTTRIKYMLDMSGQNWCNSNNPAPIEYTQAQINAALNGGPPIPERDAVGHGTVTAGIAAGNGRAYANGKYKGFAPDADLIIVKMVSDGVPSYSINGTTYPAEAAFNGCISQALQWLDQKLTALGEPAVALINSGVQLWGPIDGTSIVSRSIDQYFAHRPGRIYIEASGDEGTLPTHAGGTYTSAASRVVNFTKSDTSLQQIAIWYSQISPAQITVSLSDGTVVGPVAPPTAPPYAYAENSDGSVVVTQYFPGSEFYPVTSTSGDHFVNVIINGHPGTGQITLRAQSPGLQGSFNIYAGFTSIYMPPVSVVGPVVSFGTDDLAPGRLTDWASTHSATTVGAHVLRATWIDINGNIQDDSVEGTTGTLWYHSAGGPTRDGRRGIALSAPGQNIFGTYATNSYRETMSWRLVQDGGGWYGRAGATSGAAPIAVGAAALMLQVNPQLTSEEARRILTETASQDAFTGDTPNEDWGYGKINILGAIEFLKARGGN